MIFPNNHMLNTRSGAGQDILPVIRAHVASQQNQVPSPPQELEMDPAM
jgi:5,10-methenyltetrahydromethanopterin hydrogenase